MTSTFSTSQDPTPGFIYTRDNYQDDVASRLCVLGILELNRRHLQGAEPMSASSLADVDNMVDWLTEQADARFSNYYTASGEQKRSKDRLDRDKLMGSMESRAVSVLRTWRPEKVEGHSRGGKKGGRASFATTGTRKGRVPKFKLSDILPHMDLPPKERKAIVLAKTGMSPARYYVLLRQAPTAQARLAEQAEANRAAEVEHLKLIEDVEVIELAVKSDVEPFVPTDPWDRSFAELTYLERLIAEEVAERLAKARPALDELVASL